MQIETLSVRHFGLLHHLDMKLGDKLNVIEGSNESGKSTLSAFVRFMLYGFAEDEAGMTERRHRTSWDTGTAEGEMTVRVGGRRYRIERYSAIKRNLAGGEELCDRTRTIDIEAGSLVTETAAGEYFLGVPSEVFSSSAFVGQLDDTYIGEDRMLAQISNLLFTGDKRVSAEKAAEMLRERRDELIAAAAEHGDLSVLRARAEDLVAERERAAEVNRLLLEKEAEVVRAKKRRAELEGELSRLSRLRDSFKTVALLNRFDKLHTLEREKYLLEGEEAERRLQYTKDGFVPDASYRTELTINLRVAGDAYATYRAAQEETVSRREESERCRETERTLHRIERHGGEGKVHAALSALRRNAALFFTLSGAMLALGVLFAVLGGLHLIPSLPLALSLLAGAGALATASALLGLGRIRRAREFAAGYGFSAISEFSRFLLSAEAHRASALSRTHALRAAEEALERAKRTYLASYSSLALSVSRWGRTLPEVGVGAAVGEIIREVDEVIRITESYAVRYREMELEIAELRAGLGEESEEKLRTSLSPELRDTLCDMSYEQILQGMRERTEEADRLSREQLSLADEISGLREVAQNPVELDERIRALSDRINALIELQGALSLAYDAVSGAEENLRREIRPRLSGYARRLMSAMTDGKYGEIDVSEGLSLEFRQQDTSRSVDYLSGGTRDLAYIALRLAYMDLLYKEAPPLVFDESFAHQDNFRATCTMKALRALAEEGTQSLIFTCRSRESTIAREVDRKYKHIKMEKLRAEADAAARVIAENAERVAAPVPSPAPARVSEPTPPRTEDKIALTGDPELDALLAGKGADPEAALESALDTLLGGDADAVLAGEITSFAVPDELMNTDEAVTFAVPDELMNADEAVTFAVSPELLAEQEEEVPAEEEDFTDEEVLAEEEDFTEEEVPAEEEDFTEEEALTEEEDFTEEEVLAEEEVPAEEEDPTEEEDFTDEEAPAEEEDLAEEEVLAEEEAPAEEEVLAGEEVLAEEEDLAEDDTPLDDDAFLDDVLGFQSPFALERRESDDDKDEGDLFGAGL